MNIFQLVALLPLIAAFYRVHNSPSVRYLVNPANGRLTRVKDTPKDRLLAARRRRQVADPKVWIQERIEEARVQTDKESPEYYEPIMQAMQVVDGPKKGPIDEDIRRVLEEIAQSAPTWLQEDIRAFIKAREEQAS